MIIDAGNEDRQNRRGYCEVNSHIGASDRENQDGKMKTKGHAGGYA